ncbi:MAG: hypothetical protein PVG66_05310 [Chromatiales bacterium]|jgi:hypothetical protein
MILKVVVEDQSFNLNLEESFLERASGFFDKMDADMDNGWQMGRDWIERPDAMQKLTIVADKLLTAIENDEKQTGLMMAGYIVSRAPQVEMIEMDITGEMGHHFEMRQQPQPVVATASPQVQPQASGGLSKMEALQEAGKQVSKVFKSGKQYKFSLFNNQTGQWEESPAIADKQEAENLREFAFKKRFDELSGGNGAD